MLYIFAFAAAQATVLMPPNAAENNKSSRSVSEALAFKPVATGTAEQPIVVSDQALIGPERILQLAAQSSESASRNKVMSVAGSINVDLQQGCYKVAEHPQGFELQDSKVLNGRTTYYRCSGSVVEIESELFSKRLKVGTARGFAESNTAAIVNGGALAKMFRSSPNGIRQASYLWIGKTMSYTLVVTSRTLPMREMEQAANRMIDKLTEPSNIKG